MKFEHTLTSNWENAFRGMRNPLNSWDKSDSKFGLGYGDGDEDEDWDVTHAWFRFMHPDKEYINSEEYKKINDWLWLQGVIQATEYNDCIEYAFIGPNDINLAQKLIKGGRPNDKFLRQIFVSVDITAPIYW